MGVELPPPGLVHCSLLVLFEGGDAPPSAGELPFHVGRWLDDHASEGMANMVRGWMERDDFVTIEVDRIAGFGELPPREQFEYMGLGEQEGARLDAATHAVVVSCGDLPRAPRMGLWTTHAIARTAAQVLDGIIVDIDQFRVLPLDTHDRDLPERGEVAVIDHIVVPISREGAVVWATTLGMPRMGLPNLEMRDIPPHLVDPVVTLVNACAQALAERVMDHTATSDGEPLPLNLGDRIVVGEQELLRAHREFDETPGDDAPEVTIGIEFIPEGEFEPFIRLGPPADEAHDDPALWLTDVIDTLLGAAEPDLRNVKAGSAAMKQASDRARAELPDVRARFAEGLPAGVDLFVKVGFNVEWMDYSEFMWLSVEEWGDTGELTTRLANDPIHRTDLRAGQRIVTTEDAVNDWMIAWPDGNREGGYTIPILMEEGEKDGE